MSSFLPERGCYELLTVIGNAQETTPSFLAPLRNVGQKLATSLHHS